MSEVFFIAYRSSLIVLMKSLATLIKLHKRTLDELRRTLVSLENQKSQLEKAILALREELKREMELAQTQLEMSGFFGDFSKRMQKREEEIRAEVRKIDGEIIKTRDQITVEFGELKKFEIALENEKKRRRETQEKREAAQLDDIAIDQFIRKQKES